MKISPVSFCGAYRATTVVTSGLSESQLKSEIDLSREARKVGVDVPIYEVTRGKTDKPISIFYETKGEPASFQSNKITQPHLNNLFNSLFLLDKQGINHQDLDTAHCFYGDNGSVEFDCFRFGNYFSQTPNKNYNLPDFEYPNNLHNCENASISQYVGSIPSKDEQIDFAKMYLKASSNYHSKVAGFIAQNLNKENQRGIVATPQMLETAEVQSKVLANPDDNMAELFLKKAEFLRKQRSAFTEWDEGNGACGHPFDKDRRIKSVPMYLDSIKSTIEYSQQAKKLKKLSTGEVAKYYEIEQQRGEYYSNLHIGWVKGMAEWNFNDPNMKNKIKEEDFTQLQESYQQIIEAKDSTQKISAIDNYVELYAKQCKI